MASEGLVRVRYNTDYQLTGIRNAKGQFTSVQKIMVDAHKAMAKTAAEMIQARLRKSIAKTGRPQVSRTRRGQGENRLVNAIVDPQFQRVDGIGFTIMDEKKVAGDIVNYYYRALEVGSEKFVGRQFRGFFAIPGGVSASERRRGQQALMIIHGSAGVNHGEPEAPGGGHGGGAYGTRRGSTESQTIPVESLFASARARRHGPRAGLITIRHGIPAYHYLELGMADWAGSDSELKETQRVFNRAGLQMQGRRIAPKIF